MSLSPRVLAGAGAILASVAIAAPANAAPVTVTGGETNWQTARNYAPSAARTYIGYVLNSGDPLRGASNGTLTAAAGAEIIKPDGTRTASVTHTDTPGPSLTAFWNFEFDATGGSVDVENETLNVTSTGSINFEGHSGAMDTTLENLRIEIKADGTGGVYAGGTYMEGGGPPPAPPASPAAIDNTKPFFTLDASKAVFAAVGGGQVAITNLVPTMGPVEYLGGSYKSGVAGPDRTPNTFGGFSLLVNTSANVPANERRTIDKIVEKVVEVPVIQEVIKTVEKIVEKPVEKIVNVDKTSVRRAETLSKRPFSRGTVEVEIREAGSKTVIGEGYVTGKRLRVWVPKGTELKGKYVLDRTSGSKRLKEKSTVTIGESKSSKKSTKSKSSKKSKK